MHGVNSLRMTVIAGLLQGPESLGKLNSLFRFMNNKLLISCMEIKTVVNTQLTQWDSAARKGLPKAYGLLLPENFTSAVGTVELHEKLVPNHHIL